ncbi:IscS subfamily cysteine desulfurase [Francisellaceae bacterium]|nr:IscS subfamily cysteine desulfurase [Francisellaceae bacterium]
MKQIYLDYAATTPVDSNVAKAMSECLSMEGNFGNPASNTHFYGYAALEAVDLARENLAWLINADPREIIFTSGATESNNLALKGVADACSNKGNHIITSVIEHKAILDTCKFLETQGLDVTYLKPDSKGMHSIEQIEGAITDKTILVSMMYVNNELGVIQNISKIGELCRSKKILFHVDAAQAVGKLPIDVKEENIDLLSISAHKFYGPKGIGALYVRRKPKIKLTPIIHGGGHEYGYRSGTLATHQIVGLGKAAGLANNKMKENYEHVSELRKRLISGISPLEDIKINSALENSYPGIINIGFPGLDGEALLMALNRLALSSGSACNSAVYESSHVLRGIGLSDELADQSLRISIGRYTTEQDIDVAIDEIIKHVTRLRKLSPKYKKFNL